MSHSTFVKYEMMLYNVIVILKMSVLNVSKEIFPKEYFEIMPQVFRLHTWVGYDVDGRGDISWSNTFSKRLKVKLAHF